MKLRISAVLAIAVAWAGTTSAAVLERIAPAPRVYVDGLEFDVMDGSGVGDVTAALTPVDLQLGLGNASTSGCEAADFAGFPAGHIALIQRGGCFFSAKALNAQAAGALGVLIFNQGNSNDPLRQALFAGSLLPTVVNIPVMSASYANGVEWTDPGTVMRMQVTQDDLRVPEPGTLALLGLGLAGLAATRRRKQ